MKLSTAHVRGLSVVSICGSLDFLTSPSLQRAVARLLAGGSQHIVFDLSELEQVDRSGISVLVDTARQQRYADREVSLVGAHGSVRSALDRNDADLPSFGALEDLQQAA
jgi:anti-sigma B factor antagonist